MICLPAVARHQGVCLLCSPVQNPMLEDLFETLGGVVSLKTEDELNACMMTTCIMGPIYGIMRQSRDWLTRNSDIPQSVASYLVAKQFQGVVQDAVSNCDNPYRLDELIEEQTSGGLNEQALRNLESLGALESFDMVMDATLRRIQGKSNGTL
jgi:pyrroline-5-carboxylate reductase